MTGRRLFPHSDLTVPTAGEDEQEEQPFERAVIVFSFLSVSNANGWSTTVRDWPTHQLVFPIANRTVR